MAKVNIRNLVSFGNNDLRKFGLKFEYEKSSSDEMDRSKQLVIQTFLPLYIFIAFSYYSLDEDNKKLDSELIVSTNKILEATLALFKAADPSRNEMDIAMAFNKKFFQLNLTKIEFGNFNFIIFDDVSHDHKKAFNAENVNEYPEKNILLKLTDLNGHVRCGLKAGSKTIRIIAITNKKNGNK